MEKINWWKVLYEAIKAALLAIAAGGGLNLLG